MNNTSIYKANCRDCFIGTLSKYEYNLHIKKEDRKNFLTQYDRLESNTHKVHSVFRDPKAYNNYKNNKNMIIVLESPSNKELEDENFRYAMLGNSGTRFENYFFLYFSQVLKEVSEDDVYNVVIVNPVTKYCFNKDKKQQYYKWIEYWENSYCSHFYKRLSTLKPDVIIVLTTKYKVSNHSIFDVVLESVKEYSKKKGAIIYSGPHPSCWDSNVKSIIRKIKP